MYYIRERFGPGSHLTVEITRISKMGYEFCCTVSWWAERFVEGRKCP